MVVTRSNLNTQKSPKKIKFSDNDYDDSEKNDLMDQPVDDNKITENESENDSEEESDSAPEEESASKNREELVALQKLAAKQKEESRRLEKEKRRKQDFYYSQQQEKKRQEEKKVEEHLPEYLPEDLINGLQEEELAPVQQQKPRHLTSKDFEEFDRKLLEQQMKEEKLMKLKNKKKITVKKGPVNVKVVPFSSERGLKVPPSESRVTNVKSKWLKRKALKRK